MRNRIIDCPEFLWALYWGNEYTQSEIANIFNCSQTTISLNMKEWDIPLEEERLGRFEKGVRNNPQGEFKQGYVPWTKVNGNPKCEGKNHWNWKGGPARDNFNFRHSLEHKLRSWRRSVYRRDNFTCQICNQHGGTLNAHHLKSFAKYKELRFDIDNGITLCYECHRWIHSIIGRGD